MVKKIYCSLKNLQVSSRKYLSLAFIVVLVFFGFYRGAIPLKDAYTIYSQTGSSEKKATFLLKDISQEALPQSLGESPRDVRAQSYAAVGDFDNDGYEDLIYLYNGRRDGAPPIFRLLKNTGKKSYIEVTDQAGLKAVKTWNSINAVVFIDVDNDGWEDILITRSGESPALFMNKGGQFVQNHRAIIPPSYFSGDVKQLSVFDFDLDGNLDLYVSRFSGPAGRIYRNADLFPMSPVGADDGGENQILRNNGNGTFSSIPDAMGADDSGYTWATAISDLNNDGYPDIFNANDFGFDKLYLNEGAKRFVLSTEGMGSYRSHNSMSAEVGDFDNDGRFDIYASNNNKAGMTDGFNSLWKNIGVQDGRFSLRNSAANLGVRACGWSWGAKFADLDKDGWLDLFVVNGRHDAPNPSNWFLVHSSLAIPYWFKRAGLTGLNHSLNASLASQQRNCVFWNQGGKSFIDIALDAGVSDLKNGRSAVATDTDNDGNEEIFITNLGSAPILYTTTRQNSNHWLGVNLVGSKSNRFGVGAKIKLVSGDADSQMREVFPTNGFFSQSSRRQLFGISESSAKIPQKLMVYWPSGGISEINNLELNKYITVRESK